MSDDQEIVNKILHLHKNQYYGEIVSRYSGKIFSKALGIVHDRELAAEITQQTLVKAYTRLAEWNGGESIGPWLIAIAMHQSITFLDRARRRRVSQLDRDVPAEEYSDDHEQRLQQLEEAVGELPEQDRKIINLFYYKKCKTEDIARQLDLSQQNVLVRLHRIRQQLKRKLS